MITARQFRIGLVIEMEKALYVILEAQHIKPGKGGAFLRTRMRNLATGTLFESTLRPEDSFEQAYIEQKKMQFLYKEHDTYYFMDQLTYEQAGVPAEIVGETAGFLKDGMEITASIHKNSIIAVTLPPYVELKVTYTEPGLKGDTAKGGSKSATLETGATIKVPLFIEMGDVIKIDTRTSEYGGRG